MGTVSEKIEAFGRFEIEKKNGQYCTEISIDDIPDSIIKRLDIHEGDDFYIDMYKDGSVGIMKA